MAYKFNCLWSVSLGTTRKIIVLYWSKDGFKACDWLYMISHLVTKEYEVGFFKNGSNRNFRKKTQHLVHDIGVHMSMGMNCMIITQIDFVKDNMSVIYLH